MGFDFCFAKISFLRGFLAKKGNTRSYKKAISVAKNIITHAKKIVLARRFPYLSRYKARESIVSHAQNRVAISRSI